MSYPRSLWRERLSTIGMPSKGGEVGRRTVDYGTTSGDGNGTPYGSEHHY